MATDTRLDLGVAIERQVLAKGGTRQDIALVLDEDPNFFISIAGQLIERAAALRQDQDCFRLLNDEVVIQIPALKRPTLEQLQASYRWIKKIERDDSPEEPVTLRLATVLKSTETLIDSQLYKRRFGKLRVDGKLLGFQHQQWLLKNQKKFPAFMAVLGKVYVDFPGLIVVLGDGGRSVPCVLGDGAQFVGGWGWVGGGFSGCGRVAVSSK